MASDTKTDVINAVGETIQPAIWQYRRSYSLLVTACLLVIFVVALFCGKDIQLVTGLLFTMILLVMLGPTAEQFGKWLAQVAAIRSGTKSDV